MSNSICKDYTPNRFIVSKLRAKQIKCRKEKKTLKRRSKRRQSSLERQMNKQRLNALRKIKITAVFLKLSRQLSHR